MSTSFVEDEVRGLVTEWREKFYAFYAIMCTVELPLDVIILIGGKMIEACAARRNIFSPDSIHSIFTTFDSAPQGVRDLILTAHHSVTLVTVIGSTLALTTVLSGSSRIVVVKAESYTIKIQSDVERYIRLHCDKWRSLFLVIREQCNPYARAPHPSSLIIFVQTGKESPFQPVGAINLPGSQDLRCLCSGESRYKQIVVINFIRNHCLPTSGYKLYVLSDGLSFKMDACLKSAFLNLKEAINPVTLSYGYTTTAKDDDDEEEHFIYSLCSTIHKIDDDRGRAYR